MTDAFEVQDDLSSAQSSTNETFVTETLALDAADVNEISETENTPEQPNGFVLLGLARPNSTKPLGCSGVFSVSLISFTSAASSAKVSVTKVSFVEDCADDKSSCTSKASVIFFSRTDVRKICGGAVHG